MLPNLLQLNVRGNPLDQVPTGEMLMLLKSFTCLKELEVISLAASQLPKKGILIIKGILEKIFIYNLYKGI